MNLRVTQIEQFLGGFFSRFFWRGFLRALVFGFRFLGDVLLRCRFVAAPRKQGCRQAADQEQQGQTFQAMFLLAV